jgi:Putative restriction endonuclease
MMVQTAPVRNLPTSSVPTLENGDRLSRDEFERRYAAMPEGCRAELIEGMVYVASALRFNSHGRPHSLLNAWLTNYHIATEGTFVGDAVSVRLDGTNEPQPDVALFIDPAFGGRSIVSDDDYIEGAPELLAEIAASTVSIDLGIKKTAYKRNGVQEYIVWRVLDQQVDWFCLENGEYVELLANTDGITRSRVFPGLWLDRSALIQNQMKRVMAVLQQGLASDAYGDFVATLKPTLKPTSV